VIQFQKVRKGREKLNKDFRDKSSKGSKKGKHFIEIAKITTWKNARGISADGIMENTALKKGEKQFKTSKTSKNKLIKVRI